MELLSESKPPLLAFIGGFLGAGKTTLILKAVDLLATRGKRAAVITNDQGKGLVDTRHSTARHIPTGEVADGCFCCRFSDLIHASEAIKSYQPDVIFAEPVGSCIDLSATILQPLKGLHSDFRLAPLSVLVDPSTAAKVSRGELGPDIEFLFNNQLAEADLICLSKQDLNSQPLALPFPVDFRFSAKTSAGVDAWLDEILESKRMAGANLLDVDYKRYAAAEAALGWLNLHAEVQTPELMSPALLCGPLTDGIQEAFDSQRVQIAHLKLFAQGPTGWVKVSVTANGGEPVPEGDLLADPASTFQLAINLRAAADPNCLRGVVEQALATIPGTVTVLHFGAFRPAEPKPEYRFTRS